MIKALIFGRGHIGQKEIKEIIALFTDREITVRLVSEGTIRITSDCAHGAVIKDVHFVLSNRIPAHLQLDVLLYNPHHYVGRRTHRQLRQYTHWQIRNECLCEKGLRLLDLNGVPLNDSDGVRLFAKS